MDNLAGKAAFITGAASGIGFAMARVFAREGMRVALGDVEQGRLDGAVQQLADSGCDVVGVQVDVTDRGSVARARDAVLDAYGTVHLLCNNAGVNVPGPLHEVSYKDWDWVMGVNLWGVVHGVHEFLPELMQHGSGAHVVNTASVGGLVGMRGLGIYNATKFGVVGMTEALRADMEQCGVGVSVLCPGIVSTSLGTSERNRPAHLRDADADAEQATAEAADAAPGPGTDPLDLAEQVLAAVQANQFFINTHPEFRPIVGQRHAAIEAAFADGADPAMVEAMTELVRRF
jgi:NAD(P)-dependent dehydrogenase (short-subunit alcohol dehydrogenase family)